MIITNKGQIDMYKKKELKRKTEKISSLIEAIATALIIVGFATGITTILGLIVQSRKSIELIFAIMMIDGTLSAIILSILTITVFIPFVSKWNLDDKTYKYLANKTR